MESLSAQPTQRLVDAVREGNEKAFTALFERVYDELKSIARKQRYRVNGNLTLQTTEVVHEVYVKLCGSDAGSELENRLHFVRVCARAMRQIVIDYARKRSAQKRGGDAEKVPLDADQGLKERISVSEANADTLVALNDALDLLAERSPRQRDVVECRFFGGMTIQETATVLDVSTATVKRDWRASRAWLYKTVETILNPQS